MMMLLENQIDDMWRGLQSILEIFHDDSKPHLGYRLRVKEQLPIRMTMRPADQIVIGWKAVYPTHCPSLHLYLRSDMRDNHQYLGGPVSYCNWAPAKNATLVVRQVSHGSTRNLVRGETKMLTAGSELLWDYGKTYMPVFDDSWFQQECCSIKGSIPKQIPWVKESHEICRELCVLCGKPYRCERRNWTKRKPQKKVHFLNSHSDFLGTDWDGCGVYDSSQSTVDYNRALIEAERLNQFLQRLHSDGWKVVPACSVMKKQ
ncbi:uncharacterized protein LOC127751056 [Frankliniella occidentalis]|uniref:Uncharacterized protein LOC127751056 n=1 Tax=Frankliniella occidentalis TaxID=133901 RepID=A0A9C6XTG8_FRAOC|nr:uncharacterized protein LOC127751056 [Frankliniella occidentalis]